MSYLKLIPKFDNNNIITNIDELIRQEDEEDYEKLMRDTMIIKETMEDLSRLVEEDDEKLDNIDDNITETDVTVENANNDLERANKYQKGKNILKNTLITGVIGLVLGGPLGGLAGWAIGTGIIGITAVSGGIAGAVGFGGSTYGIMKHRKKKAEEDYQNARREHLTS